MLRCDSYMNRALQGGVLHTSLHTHLILNTPSLPLPSSSFWILKATQPMTTVENNWALTGSF
jgi:hypothetical protein